MHNENHLFSLLERTKTASKNNLNGIIKYDHTQPVVVAHSQNTLLKGGSLRYYLVLLANIRLGWKDLQETNSLAYWANS